MVKNIEEKYVSFTKWIWTRFRKRYHNWYTDPSTKRRWMREIKLAPVYVLFVCALVGVVFSETSTVFLWTVKIGGVAVGIICLQLVYYLVCLPIYRTWKTYRQEVWDE